MSHFSTIKSEASVLSATGLISKILTALKTGKWHQFCKFLKFIKFNLDGFCCCLGGERAVLRSKNKVFMPSYLAPSQPLAKFFFFFFFLSLMKEDQFLLGSSPCRKKSPFSMIKHQKLCSAVSLGCNLLTEWQSPFLLEPGWSSEEKGCPFKCWNSRV